MEGALPAIRWRKALARTDDLGCFVLAWRQRFALGAHARERNAPPAAETRGWEIGRIALDVIRTTSRAPIAGLARIERGHRLGDEVLRTDGSEMQN
ncbi:MAG: hypothetical protein WCF81_24790 [Roseiarcus sp.]